MKIKNKNEKKQKTNKTKQKQNKTPKILKTLVYIMV
jgi:hypothetical protein